MAPDADAHQLLFTTTLSPACRFARLLVMLVLVLVMLCFFRIGSSPGSGRERSSRRGRATCVNDPLRRCTTHPYRIQEFPFQRGRHIPASQAGCRDGLGQ